MDVTLSCEGRKILAHKMLLSACSTYFKNVFKVRSGFLPLLLFTTLSVELACMRFGSEAF